MRELKEQYISHLDGIRAIAVMLVLLYHANITYGGYQIFQFGYLGVDIFILLSGYLITRNILLSIKEKKFSYRNFLLRRYKRIFPILVVVVVSTQIFHFTYSFPEHVLSNSEAVLSVYSLLSNVYFYLFSQEYMPLSEDYQSLLHVWSLSLEEQFYILMPVVILFGKLISKEWTTFFIVGIFSFLVALYYNENSFSFYMIITRLWEFLIGASLALFSVKKYSQTVFVQWGATIGLLFVLLLSFFNIGGGAHPGVLTIPMLIGGSVLIIFGYNNSLLENNGVRYFGRISYGVYLWHWPLFVIFGINQPSSTLTEIFFVILVTIALSSLTYHFIENNLRSKSLLSIGHSLIFLLIISSITIAGMAIRSKGEFDYRDYSEYENLFKRNEFNNRKLHTEFKKILNTGDTFDKDGDSIKYSPQFLDDHNLNVLFVGDSHSIGMFNGFYEQKINGVSFARYGIEIDAFSKRTDLVDFFVKSNNFKLSDIIILSTRWLNRDVDALPDFLSIAREQGKKVVIYGRSPEFRDYYYNKFGQYITIFDYIMLNKAFYKKFFREADDHPPALTPNFMNKLNKLYYNLKKPEVQLINKRLKKISYEKNIKFINKEDFFCQKQIKACYALTDKGIKVHFDNSHLTREGGRFLVSMGIKKLGLSGLGITQ